MGADGKRVEKVPVAGGEPQRRGGRPRAAGRDCRDGARCSSWTSTVGGDGPGAAALSHANVVVRVPATGGEKAVLGRSEGEITDVIVDGANVYWPTVSRAGSSPCRSSGGAPKVLASDRALPGAIAADGDTLYWVEKRSESLWTMPKAGGVPRQVAQDFAGFATSW